MRKQGGPHRRKLWSSDREEKPDLTLLLPPKLPQRLCVGLSMSQSQPETRSTLAGLQGRELSPQPHKRAWGRCPTPHPIEGPGKSMGLTRWSYPNPETLKPSPGFPIKQGLRRRVHLNSHVPPWLPALLQSIDHLAIHGFLSLVGTS